jgi:glutaminyl-peptide cyclotransferase
MIEWCDPSSSQATPGPLLLPQGEKVFLRLAVLLLALVCGPTAFAAIPTYDYQVVRSFPHDPTAFTEGLFYLNGYLYESTGLDGHSQIRKVELATGRVLRSRDLNPQYFGEGIVAWKDRLIQLTWTNEVGFVYDLASFRLKRRFAYPGQGWALTQDGRRIIMSDGTPDIRFLDPETLKETGRITVTADGRPVANLNELEWVKGELFANIWLTNTIARIDPATGKVTGWIDLTGLIGPGDVGSSGDDVLNGVAYDAKGDRLFVTGKRWLRLFQIRLVKRP